MRKALAVICFLMLVPQAYAIREVSVRDGMSISLPRGDFIYIDVVIPDDLGIHETAEAEYVIESTAPPEWDDLSTQTIRTDAYNVVTIPIQFRTHGKAEGECSGRFSIILSALALNRTKSWSGEVCVSNYTDIDYAPNGGGNTGISTLNDNFDMFDADFVPSKKMVRAGTDAEFTLDIQSYADLDLEIEPGDELPMSLADSTASVSGASPKVSIKVNVTAPQKTGEYAFTAIVKAACGEDFCERTARGSMVVLDPGTDTGDTYTLSIFPKGINVKELKPVDFELTIFNPGKAKTLSLELELPEGLTSDFASQDVEVSSDSEKRVSFSVTPDNTLGFGIIKITSTYAGRAKTITAQVSTNEMLSDTMRQADDVMQKADADTRSDISSAMDEWADKYSAAEYGGELDDYNTIKSRLSAAEQEIAESNRTEEEDDLIIPSEPENQPGINPLIIVLPVAAAIGVIGFLLYRRMSSGDVANMELK